MENTDKNILTMITPEGEEIQAEVILYFSFADSTKKYLIYTYNEKDKNGMVTVHVATCEESADGKYILGNIDDEHEWDRIKDIMRSVIKEGKES